MELILTKPDFSLGTWANSGNTEPMSSEKVALGWGIEKPLNEQMNWLQNRQDTMLQYINQRGIPEWDYRTNYPKGAYVTRSDVLYKSTVENVDKDPSLNNTVWKTPFAYYQQYSDISEKVNNIINTDGYLTHYVQKKSPVMSGACKGISYLNTNGLSGLIFSGNSPRIINNNNTLAIFDEIINLAESSKKVVTMDVLLKVLQTYKVGDLYLTTNPANPSVTLGYGSWSRHAEGRALVGFNSSNLSSTPDWTKVLGNTYGTYTETLTIDQIPAHTHDMDVSIQQNGEGTIRNQNGYTGAIKRTSSTGGGKAHNNVQPSIIVYVWRRTA